MVFVSVVSFVSPTTTACVSFVGAVGGDGGGAASSVVLQSIVDRGIGRLMIDVVIFLSSFNSGAFRVFEA